MNRRISATLEIRGPSGGRRICCGTCGRALAPAGTSWKPHAAVSATPIKGLPGASSAVDPLVQLRRFSCPNCSALLDTETAMPDDPYLDDIVADSLT